MPPGIVNLSIPASILTALFIECLDDVPLEVFGASAVERVDACIAGDFSHYRKRPIYTLNTRLCV